MTAWRHGADAAFVRAVVTSPDDDAPRLVYADLLSQRGDPRGEFIVVQCALARPQEAETRARLEARQVELGTAIGASMPTAQAYLQRGFATKTIVTVGGQAHLVEEALLATTSELVTWRIPAASLPSLVDTVSADDLPLVRRLSISNDVGTGGAKRLAAWSVCAAASALTVFGKELDVAGLEVLLASTRLDEFTAHGSSLRGVGAIRWPQLRKLGLPASDLSPADVEHLMPHQPRLATLDLDLNDVGDAGARAIVRSGPPLTSLSLSRTGLTGRGAAVLCDATFELKELQLEACDWSRQSSLPSIVARFGALEVLRCGSFELVDAMVEDLARHLPPSLVVLDLRQSSIGPRAAVAVASASGGLQLRELSLAHAALGRTGVAALAQSAGLRGLRKLDLSNCEVDDAAARALIDSDLPKTLDLAIVCNPLSVAMAAALRERFAKVSH